MGKIIVIVTSKSVHPGKMPTWNKSCSMIFHQIVGRSPLKAIQEHGAPISAQSICLPNGHYPCGFIVTVLDDSLL